MIYTIKPEKLQQEFFNYFSVYRIFLKEKAFLLFLSNIFTVYYIKITVKRY
jgi:hypothetical protein